MPHSIISNWVASRKITLVGLLIVFLAGLVPLLWYRSGFIISNSDSYPLFLNSKNMMSSDLSLWSSGTMGTPNLMPALIIYQYMGVFFEYLGVSVGAVEIIFQIIFFMGAGLSMFYLTKVLYPKLSMALIIAGLFYMFNFYVLESRLNPGLIWTYTFLPLLMALLIKAITASYQQNDRVANVAVILFSIGLSSLSFASINPPNIVLIVLALILVAVYSLFKYRGNLKPLLFTFGKVLLIFVPLNIWWLYPFLNVYVLSPHVLNSQINIYAWAWTQSRSSFLNLFWLNGYWAWLPTYIPFISYYTTNSYSAPILMVLVFVPFIIAALALSFRSDKSRLNACLMLAVLLFMFLAKGVYGYNFGGASFYKSLSGINLWLFSHVPYMNMFREPTSKFTMLIVAFLSPLIGYAGAHLANLSVGKANFGRINARKSKRLLKFMVPVFLVAIFIVASFPLVDPALNPLQTQTSQTPSSYVKIPTYWYQAASWINNQSGDYSVMFTPLDDFYHMPYTWGYSGVDQLFYRLINKPIVATDYLYDYVLKPNTVSVLQLLIYSVNNDNVTTFKTLIDLLGVKYILQRNDVNSTGRNLLTPNQMRNFFSQQPYLKLVKSFGQLDIYEYTEAKPSIYTLPTPLQESAAIQLSNVTEEQWTFNSQADVQTWINTNQIGENNLTQIAPDNNSLKATFLATSGYENVSSPMIPVTYGNTYQILVQIKGQGEYNAFLNVTEYAANGTSLNSSAITPPFHNETNLNLNLNQTFSPSNILTKLIRVQICYEGTDSSKLPNSLLIDNVTVISGTPTLIGGNIDELLSSSINQSAVVLQCQMISQTKIVLTINATKPFVIATNQALDNSWVANVNGQLIRPSPIYETNSSLGLNLGLEGFSVNKTGTLDITIQYQPQVWFNYFVMVSVVTLILCVTCLVYLLWREKNHRNKQPSKRQRRES